MHFKVSFSIKKQNICETHDVHMNKLNNRVRYFRGRVSNLPLLLAEEGSQITTFGGRRVPNFSFLTQNFWREKGLKSQQIGGRRVSNEDFTPLKVAV